LKSWAGPQGLESLALFLGTPTSSLGLKPLGGAEVALRSSQADACDRLLIVPAFGSLSLVGTFRTFFKKKEDFALRLTE